MTKRNMFFLLVMVAVHYTQGQIKTTKPSHQIYSSARSAKSDSSKVKALLELADYHLSQSKLIARPRALDSAFFYTKKASALSNSVAYNNGLGNSYILFSQIARQKEQPREAEKNAEKAIALFSKTSQKENLGDAYTALLLANTDDRNPKESLLIAQKATKLYTEQGNVLKQAMSIAKEAEWTANSGKIKPGIELFKKSIALNESAGKKDNQFLNSWISILYDATGDYKSAIEYILKALSQVEQYNDKSPDAVQVYWYAGGIHDHINEKDKEVVFLQKGHILSKLYTDYGTTIQLEAMIFRLYKLSGNRAGMNSLIKDMEHTYSKLSPSGKISNISTLLKAYTSLKQFDKGEKYAKIAMKISDGLAPDDERQEPLYRGLVGYLYNSKQYELARKYAKGFLKYNEKYKNPIVETDMHHALFRIDSVQGNYDASLESYRKEMKIKGSLLNSEKNKQIAELQIKYETDKKDKNVQLLKKQGELQKSKLEKSNLLKNIAFAGALLFLIIIVLLFSRYRVKQKMNRILDTQKNEIKQKNSSLEKLVVEKEWLLKEIHHRAKNNLHMVMNLLNTQTHHLKDGAAIEAIKESKNRINAMSLIHKKLYQSETLQSINIEKYIRELIEYFKDSYLAGKKIDFILQIQPVELDTNEAVPLGLIINEAITNAVKHAFPDNVGTITIVLNMSGQNIIHLMIKDNGTGMKEDPADSHYEGMGMKLIKGLSEDLDGELSVVNNKGMEIKLQFVSHKTLLETAKASIG